MKKKLILSLSLILGLAMSIPYGNLAKADSYRFEDDAIYYDKKNRWNGGCKPKIDFYCETTGDPEVGTE